MHPFIFSMAVLLFHRSTWSNPYVKDTVYFTALVAVIHKQAVYAVDLRKFDCYVYLKKAIVAPLFCRCLIYSAELVIAIFVWKVLC